MEASRDGRHQLSRSRLVTKRVVSCRSRARVRAPCAGAQWASSEGGLELVPRGVVAVALFAGGGPHRPDRCSRRLFMVRTRMCHESLTGFSPLVDRRVAVTTIDRRFAAPLDAHVRPRELDEPARRTTTAAVGRPYLARARRSWREEVAQFRPVLVAALVATSLLPEHAAGRARAAILRLAGVSIGHGTVLAGVLRIGGTGDPRRTLRIGEHGFVNTGCHIDASAPVTVGDRVYLSQDVLVITGSHVVGGGVQRAGALTAEPVSIGDGSWLGARSTILPGVEIGRGSVVAAGSVVVDDVPPNTLVGGVPARPIRQLDP